MHEQRRQAFLQAMGVESYVPRVVLVNALPSPVLEPASIPAPLAAELAEPNPNPLPPPAEIPRPAAKSRPPVADLHFADPAPVTRQAPAPAERAADEVSFSAELVSTSIGLAFLCPGVLSAPEKRLLANIAQAYLRLSRPPEDPGLQGGRFQWPIAQGAGLPRGGQAARDALTANVLARTERHRLSVLVVFGDTLNPFLDNELLMAEGLKVLASAPPAELMESSSAKASLWQALRACPQA